MLSKVVVFLTFTVICVTSECDRNCYQFTQYTRMKRGKYYSSPPIRFYNRPPISIPVIGPFSYTPPPFTADDEPPYPGSRPYKVSKRPTIPSNDGLGDDDVTNLVKHLSKQDLDKILEFAQEKDQSYNKYKDVYNTNEFTRPYKRESRIVYKGKGNTGHKEAAPYTGSKFSNYVTEPTNVNIFTAEENSRPVQINSDNRPSQGISFVTGSWIPSQTIPNELENLSTNQAFVDSQVPVNFPVSNNQIDPTYVQVFNAQEPPQISTENYIPSHRAPVDNKGFSLNQAYANSQAPDNFLIPNNPYYTVSNEESKLPPPVNMREDFEASYTNNVPNVVHADTSYEVKNFGDLPLMDYNSKLRDVSSYHVPHYTVTQPKPSKPSAPSSPISFSSSSASSTVLKPSPAAADIQEPVYEGAPSASAAAEQSDAHLKAIKIWSHKSQGVAYTLNDDGTLTPERNRSKYG